MGSMKRRRLDEPEKSFFPFGIRVGSRADAWEWRIRVGLFGGRVKMKLGCESFLKVTAEKWVWERAEQNH